MLKERAASRPPREKALTTDGLALQTVEDRIAPPARRQARLRCPEWTRLLPVLPLLLVTPTLQS